MKKKILSLLLGVVLGITATLPVAAANIQQRTEERQEEQVIVLKEAEPLKLDVPDGFVECKFVPKETGLYRIYSEDASVDPRGYLYDETGTIHLAGDTDSAEDGINFVFECGLVAGETYNLWIYSEGDSTSCTIYAELLDVPAMEVGTPVTVQAEYGKRFLYKFVPEKTDTYDIYSYESHYSSPEVNLYDSAYQLLVHDTNGNGTTDFKISYEFEAGKTYYIETYGYSGRGSYTMQIDYTIQFEDIVSDAVEFKFDEENNETLEIEVDDTYDNVADQLVKIQFPKRGYYQIRIQEEDKKTIFVRDMKLYNSSGDCIYTTNSYHGWHMEGLYDADVYYLGLDNGSKESVTYTITIERLSSITDVIVEPIPGATTSGGYIADGTVYVTYGRGGSWYNNDDQLMYEFNSDTIRNLFKITLVYEDGKKEEVNHYSFSRFSYETNQSTDHIWTPSSTDNKLIIKADDVQKEIPVTVVSAKTPQSVAIELMNPKAALIMGQGGYVQNGYDENGEGIETFIFYESSAIALYKITFTYEDGTSESYSLSEFNEKNGLSYKSKQSSKTPWVPHGENNTLIVTIDGVEYTVNVPVMEWEEFKENVYEVTGDKIINLDDAQLILRYALGIEEAEYSYTLSDAQTCLLIALGIPVEE